MMIHPLPVTACYLLPEKIIFFDVETHKVSTFNRGGVHALLHKPFHEEVYFTRSSKTALDHDDRVQKRLKCGKNTIE